MDVKRKGGFGFVLILSLAFLIGSIAVFGQAGEISTQTPKGPYPTVPVSANALDVTWTAASVVVNDNTATVNGRELLLVHNTDVSSGTFTISSQPISGRSGDISSYSLGADETAAFWFSNTVGWATGGEIRISASASTMNLAVLKLDF